MSHLFPIACHLDVPLRGAYEGSFDEGDYWRHYRWPIGFIGDWGEGCEAVNGSSDMNGPRLDGSSFGGGVNLDGRGTNGGK